MTIWLIADTHFGEQPLPRQRATGVTSGELDEIIESRWRELVAGDDVVWHLGDVDDWSRVAALPGTKHLIFGNRDLRRPAITESGIFASSTTWLATASLHGDVLMIHDPAHAAGHVGMVIHGHLHALPSGTALRICIRGSACLVTRPQH